jgi:nucleotide-binding universal stress UspA family protein
MKRILVALDGSPHAAAVLAQAVTLAQGTGGKLQDLLAQHARADLDARARRATTTDQALDHLEGTAVRVVHHADCSVLVVRGPRI